MNILDLSKEIMREKKMMEKQEKGKSVEEIEKEISEVLVSTLLKSYRSALAALLENLSLECEEEIRKIAQDAMKEVGGLKSICIEVCEVNAFTYIMNEMRELIDYGVVLEIDRTISYASENMRLEKTTGCVLGSVIFDTSKPNWVRFKIFDPETFDEIGTLREEYNEEYECRGKIYRYEVFKYRKERCVEKEVAPWLVNCLVKQENSRRAIFNVLRKNFKDARIYTDEERLEANELIIDIEDITKYLK
ncbi:MAG: hypothetical protein IJ809_04915 [Clostridia bacterium]|nr:hypothetical protein [Clostridia bacterium]